MYREDGSTIYEDTAPDEFGGVPAGGLPVDTATDTVAQDYWNQQAALQQAEWERQAAAQQAEWERQAAANASTATNTGGLPTTSDTTTNTGNVLSGNILAGASWNSTNQTLADQLTQATGQNTINTAVGGATTADTLNQLNTFIDNGGSFAPNSTVFLQTGGVDMLQGVDDATIRSNIDQIVSTLENQGVNVVLTASPRATSINDVVSNNFETGPASFYSDIASGHGNVAVVDSMGNILQDKSLLRDALHTNAAGEAIYNQSVIDAYNRLVNKGVDPNNAMAIAKQVVDSGVTAPADNIASTGGYTKSATAPTSGGVRNVVEGDDIETQIAQLPVEIAHWARSADQRTMELIDDKTGKVLDRRAVGDFSDLDLVKMGLSMVPGAGQILSAVNIADAVRTGDLTKAAIGATGLTGMNNLNTALRVGQAIDQGNTLGALTALAGNSDVQKLVGANDLNVGGYTAKDAISVANLATAAQNGNLAGVVSNAGSLVNSPDTVLAGRALAVLEAASSGNPNALSQAVSLLNASTVGSTKSKTTADSGTPPSGLQLAGVTNGTTSDAGSGFTLGGVDAKTQAMFDEMNNINKVATGATTAPSWVTLAKDENIAGTKFQSDGSQVYTIERTNPENPDEKVYYDVVRDPETGEVYYKQGGVSFDEEGNVNPFGYERITSTKPSWSWEVQDDPTIGSDSSQTSDSSSDVTSNLPSDSNNGAQGVLSSLTKGDAGTTGTQGTQGTDGTQGNGTRGTQGVLGTLGDGTEGVDGSGKTGTKGSGLTGGNGTGDDGTGGNGTGGDGVSVTTTTNGDTVVTNGDGTTTTIVVGDDGKVTTHSCGEGYHWDEAAQACVPNEIVEPPPPPPPPPPVVQKPVTTTSPLGGAGTPAPKLDSSPQFLAGASPQKRKELAKLQQLFASLTPEMAAVLTERGFAPPKYKEDVAEETPSEKADTSIFGNLSDELYNPKAKFMASGGSIFESAMPKFIDSAKHLAAAPVAGTAGMDSPLKLATLKHLKQAVANPPRAMGGLAHGGLPEKYAKAAPKGHKPEFITGLTGYYASGDGTGQSDDIPAMLHDGDYVIDADAVAALGDGSSKAGAEALSNFQSKIPHRMSSGGEAVPAKIADGEYVFPAAFVTALGHGDNKQGAKMLDAMREELRAHKRSAPTSKIPPKAKSPLDYLRMAKG